MFTPGITITGSLHRLCSLEEGKGVSGQMPLCDLMLERGESRSS